MELNELHEGDAVLVTFTDSSIVNTPKTLALHVVRIGEVGSTGRAYRHGGEVVVGYGPGRWNTTIDNEHIASGRVKIERG